MISGNLIGLNINGAFVSCEVSCQINFNQAMVASSAIDSGGWAEFVAGLRSWILQVNGNLLLESVPSDIKAMIMTGYINQLPMFAMFSTYPQANIQVSFSGAVLFNTGSISAASTGSANWTCQLQGIGALTPAYSDLGLLIDAMPSEADYPIIIDESGNFTT
jgi:predicted secreted protein